ncbi:MAG TPA: trypsin-like peptidase domain-containing protein [Ktedonobacteraceae bacterium]|nr:trypsin-like peptidase domain-containing protein [Ktedonobacteraceae bacterium]
MQPHDQRQDTPVSPSSPQEFQPLSRQLRNAIRQLPRGVERVLFLFLFIGIFVVGCQLGGSTATNNSQTQTGGGPPIPQLGTANIEAVREAVIAKVQPAVVQINTRTGNGGGLGSGVIIDKRGYIITNNHVVQGAQSVEVILYGGETIPAQIVGTDPPDDLAVVKITPPAHITLTVAILGDSSQLRVGQDVLAIGNPLGITQTVTSGIVSALNRVVGTIPDAIQTDAPINPGNSGGALVDLRGELIGIPTATAIDPEFKAPANGVGFAVPSNRVKFIAPQLIQNGRVTNSGRAALGVQVTTVNQALAAQNQLPVDHGALIVNITAGGAAAQAGLKAGDIIVQLDGKPVNDVSGLGAILLGKKPGDKVAVQVYRGSQQQTVNVTLGELQIGGSTP